MTFAQKTAASLEEEGLKKYPIEKAAITYEVTGDVTGKELLNFNSFGWKSERHQAIDIDMYGIQKKQELYELIDGDHSYRLSTDSTYQMRLNKKWSELASYKSPEDVSEAILFSMNGTYKGDSTLLGKTCQVWTFDNKRLVEMWIWNGVMLKRIAMLGKLRVVTTASEINLEPSFEANQFEIPEFYTLKEDE